MTSVHYKLEDATSLPGSGRIHTLLCRNARGFRGGTMQHQVGHLEKLAQDWAAAELHGDTSALEQSWRKISSPSDRAASC